MKSYLSGMDSLKISEIDFEYDQEGDDHVGRYHCPSHGCDDDRRDLSVCSGGILPDSERKRGLPGRHNHDGAVRLLSRPSTEKGT